MINTIVIDETENSKELIASYLKDINDVNCTKVFNNFDEIDIDLKDIGLIIFDINMNNSDDILYTVKKLKNKHKNLDFIATSYEINSELVSKALKSSVSEFILKPILPNILSGAIKKIVDLKNNIKIAKAKTIAFFSTKGGVGRTSMAINTAFEINSLVQDKICLLDLSFNFGDMAGSLEIEPKYDIIHAVEKLEHADEELALVMCERYKESNLYVLSFKENIAKKPSPDMVIKLINSLKNIFSYIIIDMPSALDETTVSILNSCDLVLLIGMLNMASIRNVQKTLELFTNINLDPIKLRLVINRYIENSQIKLADFKKACKLEVFHKIPNNYLTLIDALNLGRAVSEVNPHSNIAKAYASLADKILAVDFANIEELSKSGYNHGIFNLLRRMGD